MTSHAATPGDSHSTLQAHRESFGVLDGKQIEAVVLTNAHGIRARIITYGAALQMLETPDRDGRLADVVLSYPDMTGFLSKPEYFGAIVGRYANRIAKAAFTLDGKHYALAANNGANSLHGGRRGFDKAIWMVVEVEVGLEASVTLKHISPDGEEGYPGQLTVTVTYALNDRDEIAIRYRATTTKPTVLNLTNHSYFNLAGAASGCDVLGHLVTLFADRFLPTDAGQIPTGETREVAGTAFDFREPRTVGERLRNASEPQLAFAKGYDHTWVLRTAPSAEPELAARIEEPTSGRVLELLTTEPGVQFYSGNSLDGSNIGKNGLLYRQSDALCLEPQHFPDSPNQPAFPSTRLDPRQEYRQTSVFRVSTN